MSEQDQPRQSQSDNTNLEHDKNTNLINNTGEDALNHTDRRVTGREHNLMEIWLEKLNGVQIDENQPETVNEDELIEKQLPDPNASQLDESNDILSHNQESQSSNSSSTHSPANSAGIEAFSEKSAGEDKRSPGDEHLPPANADPSAAEWESLQKDQRVSEQAQSNQDEPLWHARTHMETLGKEAAPTALLKELLDEDPDRTWSEDEILLVKQVTDQLTLTLENARLNAETRQQLKRQTILRETMSLMISESDLGKMLKLACKQFVEAIGVTSGCIRSLDQQKKKTTVLAEYFSQHANNKERVSDRGAPYNETKTGVLDQILHGAIHIEHLSEQDTHVISGEQSLEYRPQSILYVPLLTREGILGYVELWESRQKRAFETDEIALCQDIARQVSIAIERAQLSQQTQQALSALEVSERYQKAAAEAVTILTDRGIAALSDVLRTLGEAARTSRAYYFETQADQHGAYWRLIAEWHDENSSSQIANPALRRLAIDSISPWVDSLQSNGFISGFNKDQDPQIGKFFNLFGARSVLQFAVQGRHAIPGCIGFDQVGYDRQWKEDEIAALQTTASALASTIARENLFSQLQITLAETEALYQASARLNSASSNEEILDVIRRYTILGHINVRDLSINLFDIPWTASEKPQWVMPIAQWLIEPASQAPAERYPLDSMLLSEQIISPDRAIVVSDVANDLRLKDINRSKLHDQMGIKGLVYAPLNVGGRWIGFILGQYKQLTGFPDQEIRRLTALAAQAAVAVQNIRLFEETRRRATQLQTAAEIARDTTGTLALDTLLGRAVHLIRERFGYYHASFFLLDASGAQAIIQASTGEAGREMVAARHKLEVGSRSLIGQVTANAEPVLLNDVSEEAAMSIHRPNPLLPDTKAELGIPLKIGDKVIGALDVQSTDANAFTEDDIAVLQTLADQIAVAVDNARAYEVAQKAMEDILEADQMKSQFLANMSHELRTPLNSIIGFSRVILKGIDGPITDLQQQDLTAIYNSGQHLLGLINDVLDLSRIEAGKMELAFEDDVNLADIIKGVMATTSGLVKDKPIELHQRIDPDLPNLRVDPMKIRQILLNLLSNAAKFTEEGSITLEAGLHSSPSDEPEVLVRVIDTGPGIEQEKQAKLFQPFSQVDGSLTRKTGGSGLGLSISHHLVHLHGGHIGLESEIDKGSTFYFTLPVSGPPQELGEIGFQNRYRAPNLEEDNLTSPEMSDSPTHPGLNPGATDQSVQRPEADEPGIEGFSRYDT